MKKSALFSEAPGVDEVAPENVIHPRSLARAPGNYDPDAVSLGSAQAAGGPSLTIQSQADEADINTIVKRFGITGELPVSARAAFPLDIDFDEILDYRTCMDALNRAEKSFGSLPASVRARFGNDPVSFADFASAPENLETLREWGLAPPLAKAPPDAPPVV